MLAQIRCLVVLAGCAQVQLLTHRRSVVRTEEKAAVVKMNRTIESIGPILDGVSGVRWLKRRQTKICFRIGAHVFVFRARERTAAQKPT